GPGSRPGRGRQLRHGLGQEADVVFAKDALRRLSREPASQEERHEGWEHDLRTSTAGCPPLLRRRILIDAANRGQDEGRSPRSPARALTRGTRGSGPCAPGGAAGSILLFPTSEEPHRDTPRRDQWIGLPSARPPGVIS